MRHLGLLLVASLGACGERLSAAQFSDTSFVEDFGDPGENAVFAEVGSLPFKHVEWDYKFNDRPIARMTLEGDQLFLETPEHEVIAMDRFTGKTDWIFKVETETPLDWAPVVADGVPEEIRRLEAELEAMVHRIEDKKKEVGAGPETQALQKKRAELSERLRVSVFGDNAYFISRQVLYCVDRRSGGLRWTKRLGFVPSARPFAIRNYVFIPGADLARVWALDVDKKGEEVTFYKSGIAQAENHVMNSPVYSDPSVYFTCHDGSIYCYRVTDGNLNWTYPTEQSLRADPVIYVYRHPSTEPAGDGQKRGTATTRILFVGGTDHAFYALDADAGAILWKYECGARIKASAIAKDDTVYIASEEGALQAFEVMPMHRDGRTGAALGPKRNGHMRWKIPLGERFLFKGKERIYVMGPQREIYAMNEFSGEITGRYPLDLLQHVLTNTKDEFIYVANAAGYVFCLRESKQKY